MSVAQLFLSFIDELNLQNAFSSVASYSFGLFTMLVVDFMHEFELGVWKAIFTHLIRILVANGGDAVQSLNDRSVTH
jgi:hypothetical protein